MKIGAWSTSAGSNTATPPDGFPEGMAPSGVNDAAREVMAQIKTFCNDAEWFDRDWTPTYVNANSFTVTGDRTSALHSGRALKLYDASTIVRRITSASFTAVTTVLLDSGNAITSSLSSFAVGIQAQTPRSAPRTPYLHVRQGLVASVSAAATTLSWRTVQLDNYGWFASSGGKYMPQLAGIYGVSGYMLIGSANGVQRVQFGIAKNFSGSAATNIVNMSAVGDLIAVSGYLRMNGSSDYIQCYANTSVNSFVPDSAGQLTITYIGPA